MEKQRPSFLIYKDSFEVLQELSDEDLGKVFRMIFEYTIHGVIPDKKDKNYIAFSFIKLNIDRDEKKYLEIVEKNKANGSKGGRPKKAKKATALLKSNRKRTVAKKADIDIDRDIVIDSDIEKDIVIDNNKTNNFKKWTEEDFKKDITANKGNYTNELLLEFYNTWREKDSSGKMRFQLQKTWETKLRLAKWKQNNYSKIQTTKNSSNDYDNSTVKNLPSWNK